MSVISFSRWESITSRWDAFKESIAEKNSLNEIFIIVKEPTAILTPIDKRPKVKEKAIEQTLAQELVVDHNITRSVL
jgi:hypothetical protein